MDHPPFAPKTLVRRLSDASQVGIVERCMWDDLNDVWTVLVSFGNARKSVDADDLEPFNAASQDLWEDLHALHLSRYGALRRLLTYERLRKPSSPIAHAFGTARARMYPYQFKPLLKFLENPTQRALIADDVGLGKTIEAGYILREWRARHELDRVLIVVPARLCAKWRQELEHRFGERFDHVRAREMKEALQGFKRGREAPPFNWIVSYETVRGQEIGELLDEVKLPVDLLVLDEAHRVRNRQTNQYRSARAACSVADAIVFLSATPVQTGLQNLHTLLDLLEPAKFGTFEMFERTVDANRPVVRALTAVSAGHFQDAARALRELTRNPVTSTMAQSEAFGDLVSRLNDAKSLNRTERVALQREVADFSLLGHVLSRTRKHEVMENWPVRVAQNPTISLSEDEKEIYRIVRLITRLLNPTSSDWGQSMAALMAFRYTASCIPAAAEYLRDRLQSEGWLSDDEDLLDELYADAFEEDDRSDDGKVPLTANELAAHVRDVLSRCPEPGRDSKFLAFVEALRAIWLDDRNAGRQRRKVVVFSFFRRTLTYLQRELARLRVVTRTIHGGVPIDERNAVIEEFLTTDVDVLLSSEVGGEGLDLQQASVVVNYDLPWNPMVVEQRIGRIDRIGQKSQTLVVVNMVCEETVEERILLRLYSRIGLFRETIGEIDEILGPIDVTRLMVAALRGALTEAQLEAQADKTADAAERKLQETRRLIQESDGLLAADQVFLDEIQRMIKGARVPGPAELEQLVVGELRRRYAGVQIADDAPQTSLLALGNGMPDFESFARARDMEAGRLAGRLRQGPVRVTFDPEVAMSRPGVEYVQPRHPLVQFVLSLLDNEAARTSQAYGVELHTTAIARGHWVLGVWGVEVRSARVDHRLESVAVHVESGQTVDGEEAELLFSAVLNGGREMDPIPRLDRRSLEAASERLRAVFERRYSQLRKELRFVEQRRYERLRSTWQQTLQQKVDRAAAVVRELEAKSAAPSALRLHKDRLKKAHIEYDTRMAELGDAPKFGIDSREVMAGLVVVLEH